MSVPARQRAINPTGRSGSIKLSRRAGDGVYLTTVHGYTNTAPSGARMPKLAALSAVDIARFPPALSPTTMIFSPVEPAQAKIK